MPEICKSTDQLLQSDIASRTTIISWKLWKSLRRPELEPISLSIMSACCGTTATATHVADSQLNQIALDWLGQHGLLDPPINAVCNRVHSATSTTSFTAEVMVQRFHKALIEVLGLCNHTRLTLKLIPNAQSASRPKRPVPLTTLPKADEKLTPGTKSHSKTYFLFQNGLYL
ncbi:unnamed protein product [Hymenolepis diminuta]|uniref:Uncharacterized protein n=1 Tax=Hymenolepis diminuta TaxID=6216 RepID=A0A564Y1I0_HYMDI|nr:unnamed protein product [Hymenolepis diminuta]